MRKPLKEREKTLLKDTEKTKDIKLNENEIKFLIEEIEDIIDTNEMLKIMAWKPKENTINNFKNIVNKLKKSLTE